MGTAADWKKMEGVKRTNLRQNQTQELQETHMFHIGTKGENDDEIQGIKIF